MDNAEKNGNNSYLYLYVYVVGFLLLSNMCLYLTLLRVKLEIIER